MHLTHTDSGWDDGPVPGPSICGARETVSTFYTTVFNCGHVRKCPHSTEQPTVTFVQGKDGFKANFILLKKTFFIMKRIKANYS